ncbi:MAG: hypothetical protein V1735_04570 [Nanoarchaeota archaeon]
MNVKQIRATFKVESESTKGKFYSVTLEPLHCDCPHFMTRLQKTGEDCKHLKAARAFIRQRRAGRQDGILAFVQQRGEMDAVDLIEQFDEAAVNDLIRSGDLIEKDGKIRRLE